MCSQQPSDRLAAPKLSDEFLANLHLLVGRTLPEITADPMSAHSMYTRGDEGGKLVVTLDYGSESR